LEESCAVEEMASYALGEFLGDGLLKDLGPTFAEDGWDDVPTIKVIGLEDMEVLGLSDAQRVSAATIALSLSSLRKHGEALTVSVTLDVASAAHGVSVTGEGSAVGSELGFQ
jgi:hypothetical protein